VRLLVYEDDALPVDDKLVFQIDEIIRDVKPDIVITHHPQDTVDVHNVFARATLKACQSAAGIRRATRLGPHKVAQIFFMGIPVGCTTDNVINALTPVFYNACINVTDVIDKKFAALDKLAS